MNSPFANTPAQYISQQSQPRTPSPADGPIPGDSNEQDARVHAALYKINELKSELQQAFNPYSLKTILEGTLNVLEYVLGGQVTPAQSHQVPGAPVATQDPNAARVAFSNSSPSPSPGSPITNGDVQFIPGPQQPAQPVAGQQANGQTVEYYGGPAGSPYESGAAQKVEFFGGPGAGQTPQPPSTTPGVAQAPMPQAPMPQAPMPQAPMPGAPQAPQQPYHDPRAGMPVQNGQATVDNPTGATFTPGAPPVSVEAGHQVPQPGAATAPPPPAAVSTVPPDRPATAPPSDPQAGLSPEQVTAMLPGAEIVPNPNKEEPAPQVPPAMPIPTE